VFADVTKIFVEPRDPPDRRDLRIAELEAIIVAQAAKIAELEEIIRQLTARLGLNSLNSSTPPSRDDAKARQARVMQAETCMYYADLGNRPQCAILISDYQLSDYCL